MGRVQSSVGLITGVPILDTVDQLMAIAAKPRDLIESRTGVLQQQQLAVSTLAGLIYAIKTAVVNLGKADTYQQRQITSSDPQALAASLSGKPAKGSYEFTPVRVAQSHNLLSSGFKSQTDPIGAGTVTIRFGDHVQRSASLSLLNGGAGIQRGKIRIVDRSGAFADIDLSTAQTVDDVLEAINANSTVNVTATARDGRIRLTDNTGQSVSNLRVLEVAGGRTAESLGLAGIDVAAASADGAEVLRMFDDMDLDALNDGAGVTVSTVLADVAYTLRDGTTGQIDFSVDRVGTADDERDVTVGDVLRRISEQSGGKLRAEIAPDGRRFTITDLTTGEGEFTLSPLFESKALASLGLDAPAVDGVITGRRVLSGLRTVALSSLNGGSGLGALGQLSITDRTGAAATVDLSAAETLEDVIETINAAGVSIQARVNQARNGIDLVDTSGAQDGSLVVASADSTGTAERLHLAVNGAVSSVNSGDLHLKIVSENTRLDSLNGGAGVARGQFVIQDSTGRKATVDLRSADVQTIGDVLRAINRLYLGARAELNETGDGILLRDTAGGSSTLTVSESGTTARDLGLARTAKRVEVEGQSQQVIDGSMTYKIELGAADSLADLKDKINALGAGFSASSLSDGSARPWHLALVSARQGKAGELLVDASGAGFRFDQTAAAQDAMLVFGPASSAATAMLVSSSSNTLKNVVEGMNLEIKQATGATVTVRVDSSNASLLASAKTLVENYNKFRDKLAELTAYNADAQTAAVLTGDATALRFDVDLTRLVSGQFLGAGRFRSLEEVGIGFTESGKLEFDQEKFEAAFAEDPQGVEQFFSAAETGFAARLGTLIEQLAGATGSLVSRRLEALEAKIAQNDAKIERMDKSLEAERLRLLTQFYNMELAVARIQNNLEALDSISWILDQYRSDK